MKLDSSLGFVGFLYEFRELNNELGDGFFMVVYVVVKDFGKLYFDKFFIMVYFCFDVNIIEYWLDKKFGNKYYRVGIVVEVFFGKCKNIDLDFVVVNIIGSRNGGKYNYIIEIIK